MDAHLWESVRSERLTTLTIKRLAVNSGEYLTPYTEAQHSTIETLEEGLCWPVQTLAAVDGKALVPVWTDGDGDYFAIKRDGEVYSLGQ